MIHRRLGCSGLFFFFIFFLGFERFDEWDEEEDAPGDKTSADDAFADPEAALPDWWEVSGDLDGHDVGVDDAVEKVVGSASKDGNVTLALLIWFGPWLGAIEVKVAASVAHLFVGHVIVDVEVADDRSNESPLLTENGGKETIVAAGPLGSDTVEGGHDTVGSTFFDGHFEWLEVDFTDGLLVAPGKLTFGVTVGFLIVKSEVLDVSVDAVFLNRLDDGSGALAGLEWVFAVVFGVTSAEWGTVHVDTWAIPSGVWEFVTFFVADEGFVADGSALSFCKLKVPGLSN